MFFAVLLVAMPHNSPDARRQMIRECRKIYKNDFIEKKNIDKFDKEYRACDAIHWYTRSGFLSILINKTLRSENVYALYIFRYFIFDLCENLAAARYSSSTPISVYRGTILRREEVEQLRVGSLVSTNGFLSSSRCIDVALSFMSSNQDAHSTNNRSRNDAYQFVLFQIVIDLNQSPDVIVADISNQSCIKDEEEFLFDLGTTFSITKIFYDENRFCWTIEMIGSNQVAQLNHQYDSYIRERLSETSATILFGRMLAHLSEYRV